MSPVIAQRFHHAAFPGGVDVWPKLHDGILNYGLDVAHYNARWDGEDPYAGFFPTTESVAARAAKGSPRDGLGNLRKGMTTHVKVITLTPGKQIFRFGQNTEKTETSAGSGHVTSSYPASVWRSTLTVVCTPFSCWSVSTSTWTWTCRR